MSNLVAVLVMTDGRRDCISRTIPSLLDNLQGELGFLMIHDDSGDRDYQDWLIGEFPDWIVMSGSKRLGFGGAIQRAWNITHGAASDDHRYVWHQEDDFTFNRPVNLDDMIHVLDEHPYLAQMALRRQPWNDEERAGGGQIERFPREDFPEHSDDHGNVWLEHRRWFTTNPSLIPRYLVAGGWPTVNQSEGIFTHQLIRRDPALRFGYWGTYDSGVAWVHHIGEQRVGNGY